jgi:zinc protease
MMKMVVALNASQFRGEARVTCYTCHRGTTQPSRLPPLPPLAAGSGRAPAPTPLTSADRVLAAYVAAVGGDTAARGAGLSIRGWDERSEGRYGKFEITVAGNSRYRITFTTPEATTNQGLDAEGAWVAANDKVQRLTSPGDVARMRRIAMRYRPVKEQPANMRVVGIERVGDHDAYVLQGKVDSVTTQWSYFDVVTGLLRRELTTTETLLVPLVEQVDYDDYRDVGGVQLPFRIRVSDGAPYDTTTRTVMEIRRDVPADDAFFGPPT